MKGEQDFDTTVLNLLVKAVWCFRFCGFRERITGTRIGVVANVEKFLGDIFKGLFPTRFAFQIALPDNDDVSIFLFKFGASFCIALNITADFAAPKFFIGFWQTEILAVFVTVPKTAVNKYDGAQICENEVWTTWQFAVVQTIAVPCAMKEATHKHFGLGVFASDCRHVLTAFFLGFYIGH